MQIFLEIFARIITKLSAISTFSSKKIQVFVPEKQFTKSWS